MHFRPLAVLAAMVVAAGGCFAPEIQDGQVPCGPTGECPSGFQCMSGRCSKGGVVTVDAAVDPGDAPIVFDAPLPGDARADAGMTDAAADAGIDAGAGTIQISFLGTGAGTVTGGGSSCTASCARNYAVGTAVSFTATPMVGSLFVGWSGVCTGNAACQVVPTTAPKTLEATFIPVATVQLVTSVTGPGTIVAQPAGASCGAGCQAYASGTTIRLVPTPDPGLSFIGFTGGNCEAAGTDPCTIVINGNTTVMASFCETHRVVDASAGMDTFEGTCVRPFRTITKALVVATSGQTVQVRPGVYSAVLGEMFPLEIPDGVRLIGNEAEKGGVTRIQGGSAVDGSPGLRAAVVVGARSTLAGFVIINPSSLPSSNGVVVTKPDPGFADSAIVRNNTVTNCGTDGIYIERARMVQVDGNVVSDQDSGGVGVRITADAAGASIERNVIVRNTYGLEVHVDADLGAGTRQSAGRNTFSCNLEVDVVASGDTGPISVTAANNSWDHVPPSDGCGSNIDLCRTNATVSLAGALLATSPCN